LLLTNRYYDSGTGRFLTRDPIGTAGGTNLYSFVGNSPLRGIDPSGLCDDDDGIDALQDAYGAFWKAVDKVGDLLNTGIELGGSVNPLTSAEIGINKIGQGKYLEGSLFLVPLVGGALGEGVATADAVATEGGSAARTTLYHYTSEEGYQGILESGQLNASLEPRFAHAGPGQYLTDIAPGSLKRSDLARQLFGNARVKWKTARYIEVDVTGLPVQRANEGVHLIPGEGPLDLTNRIVSHGATE
jgi:uncharacterized protein RhaS with RHS repeats